MDDDKPIATFFGVIIGVFALIIAFPLFGMLSLIGLVFSLIPFFTNKDATPSQRAIGIGLSAFHLICLGFIVYPIITS
ncbi:MAG: hypothetical protein AAFN77_22305 [Planctomycetota bacterium]